MTHEQKPVSAEFRTREEQVHDAFNYEGVRFNFLDEMDQDAFKAELIEAEARGAAEQRRKDAEGAEPVAWLIEDRSKGVPQCAHTPDRAVTDKAHSDKAARSNFKVSALYTRPANVAALEDRVKELEQVLVEIANIKTSNAPYLTDSRYQDRVMWALVECLRKVREVLTQKDGAA